MFRRSKLAVGPFHKLVRRAFVYIPRRSSAHLQLILLRNAVPLGPVPAALEHGRIFAEPAGLERGAVVPQQHHQNGACKSQPDGITHLLLGLRLSGRRLAAQRRFRESAPVPLQNLLRRPAAG